MLPIINIEGRNWYIDKRLSQIRAVDNPHEYEDVSPEVISYWIDHGINKL